MNKLGWIAVASVALTLGGCGQKTDVPVAANFSTERAYFEDLAALDFSVEAPTNVPDIASAFAALPDGLRVEMGDVTLDTSNGAVVVDGFALLFDWNGTDVGLRAETARFWNFDPDALDARINGRDLDQAHKLADRIELNNIKTVGLAEIYGAMFDGYIDVLGEFGELEDDVFGEMAAIEVKTYEMNVSQLVIDGLVLEPFTYAAWTPEIGDESSSPSDLEFIHTVQIMAAGMRAFSFDAVLYSDLKLDYVVANFGADVSMEMAIPMSGVRDYQRGDMAYSGSWDTIVTASVPMPDIAAMEEDSAELEFKTMDMSGGIALYTIEGVRLAKALEAVSNWTLPDADDADFMSLGRMLIVDYRLDVAGNPFFGLDRFEADLTQFHWLLPTKVSLHVDNLRYEIGELMTFMFADVGDGLDPEIDMEVFKKGLAIAKKYDFDCFCGDYNLDLSWDEETGDVAYREQGELMAAFESLTTFDLTIPKPAMVAQLITDAADGVENEQDFVDAFTAAFEFRSAKGEITDTGGLIRLFEMAHEIGETFPDQEGMAVLTYNSPEKLREMAVTSFTFARPMVREELPAAEAWLDAVSDFVAEGGVLTWQVAPKEPITVATLEAFDNDPDPAEFVEIIGLSVTHTK